MCCDSEEGKKVTRTMQPTVETKRKRCAEMKSIIDLSKFKITSHAEHEKALKNDTDAIYKLLKDKNLL